MLRLEIIENAVIESPHNKNTFLVIGKRIKTAVNRRLYMKIEKPEILKNICYTELVYDRINKKLSSNFSKSEIENLLQNIINETEIENFQKIGKNIYVSNEKHNIKITINSNTHRIITVDKLTK